VAQGHVKANMECRASQNGWQRGPGELRVHEKISVTPQPDVAHL
jgi:hypothetical protein